MRGVAAKEEQDKALGSGGAAQTAVGQAAAPGKVDPNQPTQATDPRLSDERKKLLYEGERRMNSRPTSIDSSGKTAVYRGKKPENAHGDKATNLFDGSQVQSSGTSCGLLPGVLLQRLNLKSNPKVEPITRYVTSGAPGGMEDLGTKYGAWVAATGSNRPLPGDIYVMNHLDGTFAHVGVVHTVGEREWVTMDSGQGRGLQDAALQATKTVLTEDEKTAYNNAPGKSYELGPGTYHAPTGKTPDTSGPDPRRVNGWIDLDKLIAYARGTK